MAYVVSPNGATDSVPDGWLDRLLRQGFRPATSNEIAAWYASQGLANPHAIPILTSPVPKNRQKPSRKRIVRKTDDD